MKLNFLVAVQQQLFLASSFNTLKEKHIKTWFAPQFALLYSSCHQLAQLGTLIMHAVVQFALLFHFVCTLLVRQPCCLLVCVLLAGYLCYHFARLDFFLHQFFVFSAQVLALLTSFDCFNMVGFYSLANHCSNHLALHTLKQLLQRKFGPPEKKNYSFGFSKCDLKWMILFFIKVYLLNFLSMIWSQQRIIFLYIQVHEYSSPSW